MPDWSWTRGARTAAVLIALAPRLTGAGEIAAPPAADALPAVEAARYLLVDQGCGWSLGARDAQASFDPGTLARLMTVYLVLEQLRFGPDALDTVIEVSVPAPDVAGPRLYLRAGERIRVGELLQAVAVAGSVDAAHALAAHFAGSDSLFVDRMNAAARSLDLLETRFTAPVAGGGARSSARDLVRLALRLAITHPGQFDWFAARRVAHAGIEHHNSNPLLWQDPGADGVAHGTDAAGRHLLLASMRREGRRVFAMVAGASSADAAARDAARLLEHGFSAYESRVVIAAGAVAARIPLGHDDGRLVAVGLHEDLYACVPRGMFNQVFAQVAVRATVDAPVEQGAELGTLTLRYGGRPLLERPLIAMQAAAAREHWWRRWFH